MPIPDGYQKRGVKIAHSLGNFHFHRRLGGGGDGCVVRTWMLGSERVKDVLTRDCRDIADAEIAVEEHLAEMAVLIGSLHTEYGW
jgi:hypothetical protein